MMNQFRVAQKLALFNQKNEILILRFSQIHHADFLRGYWDFPGGGLKWNESLNHGINREINEEIGEIDFDLGKPIFTFDWIHKNKPKMRTICIMHQAKFIKGNIVLNPPEHDKYAWCKISELGKFNWEPDINQAVTKLKILFRKEDRQ